MAGLPLLRLQIVDAIVVASKSGAGGYGSVNQGLLNVAIKSAPGRKTTLELDMPKVAYYPKDNTLKLTLVEARF